MFDGVNKIICLDYYGCLNTTSKNTHCCNLLDKITEGFFEWLHKVGRHYKINIYIAGNINVSGRNKMKTWLAAQFANWINENELSDTIIEDLANIVEEIDFVKVKPIDCLFIDNKALTFNGDWSEYTKETIDGFVPWNQK